MASQIDASPSMNTIQNIMQITMENLRTEEGWVKDSANEKLVYKIIKKGADILLQNRNFINSHVFHGSEITSCMQDGQPCVIWKIDAETIKKCRAQLMASPNLVQENMKQLASLSQLEKEGKLNEFLKAQNDQLGHKWQPKPVVDEFFDFTNKLEQSLQQPSNEIGETERMHMLAVIKDAKALKASAESKVQNVFQKQQATVKEILKISLQESTLAMARLMQASNKK